MSFFLVVDIIVGALFILLAYFALLNRHRKIKEVYLFIATTFFTLIWIITTHISNDVSVSPGIAIVATRLLFPASFLASLCFFGLLKEMTEEKLKLAGKGRILLIMILSIIFASPLTVKGIYEDGIVYGVSFGPAVYLYGAAIASLLAAMIIIIAKSWNSSSAAIRQKIRPVGLCVAIAAPLIFLMAFLIPNMTGSFEVTKIALTPTIIIIISLYYATIRHGLFDLRGASIRTMTYILTLSVLTAVYFILAYLLSIILFKGQTTTGLSISPLNVILALIMAIIFQPIKQVFDKLTDSIFYRGVYNRDVFLKEFSKIVSYNSDLERLLRKVSEHIIANLKPSAVSFYVIDRHLVKNLGQTPMRLSSNTFKEISQLAKNGDLSGVVLVDTMEPSRLSKILAHHGVKIIIPMRIGDEVIGFMLLGEHLNDNYTPRDVSTLESVMGELVISIQNSLSVEVIRDLNENLQKKVDDATGELRKSNEKLKELDKTKDEFLSIASHQLRTPLTSIKGYIDMLREGDFGEVNDAQKTALNETFTSSERMVRLINDFLNVSRLQTGKFSIDKTKHNLKDLVEEEVKMISLIAKQSDIKMNFQAKDVGTVKMDVEKIRQVIVNMLDNAIYYSKPNSTVYVDVKQKGKWAEFTVKDSGIGVPEEDQQNLFGKFFRAANAQKRRPDGTGVGLFLARKVILGHGGEMVFHSKEGEGSTFGFRIPL